MATETATRWSCTRAQLIDALAAIRVEGVKMSGPLAGMVLADDMADAILAQLEPADSAPAAVTVSREDLRAVLPVIDAHGSPAEDGALERLRAAAGEQE